VATSLVPVAVSGDRQPGSGTFTVSLPVFSVARRRNFIWVTVTIYAAATTHVTVANGTASKRSPKRCEPGYHPEKEHILLQNAGEALEPVPGE